EKNNLHDLHYAEPFAGGAGLALNLLTKGYAKKIYLNDINPAIYAFWYSIINHTHDFCKKIEKTDVTIDEWHHQRKIMVHAKSSNIFELGYSTFFLNRTNRSGILLGGILGGKEQKGNWKLDARFNKYNLIERIERISKYKNNIIISNLDAREFIQMNGYF
ncbi:MAG: DNA adenine methylase, partial [Candidatus Arsenophonus phytopathogenicus]